MPLHTGRLLLTPQDPQQAPTLARIRERLIRLRFLGEALPPLAEHGTGRAALAEAEPRPAAGETSRFAPGPGFFDVMAFTGCAVQLVSPAAPAAAPSCHIVLEPPSPGTRFFHGRNSRPPRCPACRRTNPEWRAQVNAWSADEEPELHCPSCDQTSTAWSWDWRGHAGFGRLVVRIEDVFPGEATPLPRLLETLAEASDGLDWHWFTVQD